MPDTPHILTFRPFERADVPMLSDALAEPRVAAWFEDPDYAEELTDHLQDDRIDQWIVLSDTVPVAYLQDYRIDGWAEHPLGFLPPVARGLDTFVLRADRMGQGLAPRYLRLHAAALFARGIPALGIDPHPWNLAAIRAYEKAGFSGTREARSDLGPVRIMTRWPA